MAGMLTEHIVEDCIIQSNINELIKLDKEYTLKAQMEGKPFYKWDTNIMTMLIYDDAIEENGEWPGVYDFLAKWLAITLKFVDNDIVEKYMLDFYYNKQHHYKDIIFGEEIFKHMYYTTCPYIYAIYHLYLQSINEQVPDYISKLANLYFHVKTIGVWHKLPSLDGSTLIDADKIDVDKYVGTWISPERAKEIDEYTQKILQDFKDGKLK